MAQFGEHHLIFMLSWGTMRLSICKLCSSRLPGLSDYDINIIMSYLYDQPQFFDLDRVFPRCRDDINAGGVDAAVSQDIRQL